ncbi:Zn-dependent exopeptidase [Exidia glandulosa HHB12029]|uniref:Zn-dependent exopeptidase n=1 Tax=Exidia glandulosa HHB12029 TaxID=1314781 RepID=A0A165QSE9_EXIGL|nr:Zn-dependent exopeptidase [Exidia glandulosa HHB12029]
MGTPSLIDSKEPLLPATAPATVDPIRKRQARQRKLIVFALLATILLWFHHSRSCSHNHGDKPTSEDIDIARAFAYRAHAHGKPDHKKPPPRGWRAIHEFLKVPNNDSALATSRLVATKPHIAGSPQDLITAQNVLELFNQEFKLPPRKTVPIFQAGSPASRLATLTIPWTSQPRAWIDTYYPVLNTPLDRHLEILDDDGKVSWSAELEEVADDTDPEAGKYVYAVPTFHGLSKGGDVKGKLIYANYGLKADYDALEEKGVNFTGAIVLTRYGGNFRGLKIKRAQELGAVGVLIYSDPRDDGGITVDNGFDYYPNGPARNPTAVQRGSVQFISTYPGDPTTPGRPSYANVTRDDPISIPTIPSLPISWANAQKLLELVKDTEFGPSKETIRLHNNVDDKVTPIWNTMGVIPGHIKDEVVLVGNHRDAWVMGATDPSSGTASLHEVVRGFAALWHKGWRPLRTIVIASWDAEEYGLIGSTEYGEDFHPFLAKHVVAYLNLDSSVSGANFHAAGSPSLAHLVRSVADHIPHPTDDERSLWDTKKDVGPFAANVSDEFWAAKQSEEDAQAKLAPASLGVSPLGSGSDYTVFLQHIGIASSDGGFGGAKGDAVYHYHSVYDSERWQEVYADPGFHRHVAAAQFLGAVTLRLSDSIVLPINTTQYALQLEEYLNVVEGLAQNLDDKPDLSTLRDAIAQLVTESIKFDTEKKAAEEGLKKLFRKKSKFRVLRKLKCKTRRAFRKFFGLPVHSHHDLAAGTYDNDTEMEWLEAQRAEFVSDAELTTLGTRPEGWPQEEPPRRRHPNPIKFIRAVRRVRRVNHKLATFERGFISKDGIKDREWYKHLGVAPGKWLGYGATTLPALTEAITIEKNSTLVNEEAARLTEAVEKLAGRLSA